MRRLKVAAAILTVAALALAGCAPGPADNTTGTADATVVVGSRTPPVNLDNTGGAGQGITEALYRNVYEPLLALEEDGSIKPTLAESDEVSDDGLTYTFKLRAGVKFHSGKDLKASDVKFSFERVLAESSKAARKADLGVISKVDATDDRTVTVTLKQRAQSFRYLVTYVWILPENITNVATTTDGTGPYKVSDYQAGTQLTLQRTDGYWGEQAKNKEVTFRYFSSSTAQTNALTSGQIDLITNVDSPEQVKAFEGKSDYKVSEGKSTVKQVLAFNDRKAPFNNTAVRKAIRKAINREAIRKATWDTYGQLIGSFVPPQDPWYEDLTAIDAYDPTKAKAELTAAGYPNGFTFTLVTPNTEVHQISAQAVKSDLAKVGITVNIELIDPSSWYEKVFQNKDFDVTLQEHVNDRDLVWYGNPDFYWGYNNPDVTQWVKDAQAAETPEQQTEIYKKIARKISEDAASDWLYLYPQLRVAASNLSGYPTDGKNSAFFVANIVKS